MASVSRDRRRKAPSHALQVRDLHVYFDQSHALQGVNLALTEGVHAVVGRNGMGKTTLCNAIMGLVPARRGSIKFNGHEITGLPSHRIASLGIGYTPQGRRLWRSLNVDEHLRLVESGGSWSVSRIYEIFPRLAERRRSGAGQLSGGEQQMLAISRALLQDPELLILDEPTEGLAPLIVDQVEHLLAELASEQNVSILLIEQNISVATTVAQEVAIMANGRINRIIAAAELAGDRILQERLLGVGRHSHDDMELTQPKSSESEPDEADSLDLPPMLEPMPERHQPQRSEPHKSSAAYIPPTRWSSAAWLERQLGQSIEQVPDTSSETMSRPFDTKVEPLFKERPRGLAGKDGNGVIYVVGTYDTKGEELNYIRNCIAEQSISVKSIDLSTSGKPSSADIPPHVVSAYHPNGSGAVFSDDRGASVRMMAQAFENYARHLHDVAGMISAAGSGGTALATPAMRLLPVGTPKVMISTVASGDVSAYVGASDITMMYSVADIQGLNRISKKVLANGAGAIAGMVKNQRDRARPADQDKPGIALTMFGVTTPAVQQVVNLLDDQYDCVVLHATGTGGRSMEKLVDSGLIVAALDLTTTEVCDMMMGGVFAADEDRFGAFIRTQIPWVGSVGALDMVNFGTRDSVPHQYSNRTFVEHNPQVTLMRTTAEENCRIGEWLASRINLMDGPVRFLIPEGGVSALDAPGQPFYDPEADKALFDAISEHVRESANRRIIRTPHHINDAAFAQFAVDALEQVKPSERGIKYGSI